MKRTALYDIHKSAGAALVPFAGWEMPVSYSGTVSEVAAVRSRSGIFDVSHMGEARVTGPQAFAFVQSVTANDASKLSSGKAQYSLLLDESGGIIDDIIVYCEQPDNFLIVLNAGCKDKDWAWLTQNAEIYADVTLGDESDQTALLAIQGPDAVNIVEAMASESVSPIKRFHFRHTTILNTSCMVSRTGYTGEDGFEIFCDWDDAPILWEGLAVAGALPCGLGARDVLRLEAAYPLYGHELDADHLPAESGVAWAVKTAKGPFIGCEALRMTPAAQILVGLRMAERAIPREGYAVFHGNSEIGRTTSGTWSPTIQAGIAMARIDTQFAEIGTEVSVDIRGRQSRASVVSLPFYRNGV